MDYLSAISYGTYADPTANQATRAALFGSWGLLETAGTPAVITRVSRILGFGLRKLVSAIRWDYDDET